MSVENLSPAAYRIFIKTLLRKQALSLSECTFGITRTFPPFQASPRCLVSQFSVFHFSARCIFAHFCHFINQKEHSIQLYSLSHFRFHILPAVSTALLAIHAPLLSSSRLLYKFIQYVYYSSAFLHKSHAKSLIQPKRELRPERPREAPPTQAACMRGVRGPARRMESSPAPGSLWFLSPAGKELVRHARLIKKRKGQGDFQGG